MFWDGALELYHNRRLKEKKGDDKYIMKTISPSLHREIVASGSLEEINKWIKDQWMHIPRYKEILIDRIREMKVKISPRDKNECSEEDINSFYFILISRPNFTKDMYDLMNIMTNSVILPNYGENAEYLSSSKICPWSKIIMLSLADISKVQKKCYKCFEGREKQILSLFYSNIIDIYLPCFDPQALINVIFNYADLSSIIMNARDTNKIIERFNGVDGRVNQKTIVLFHKIILDIYTNEEASYEFIEKLYQTSMIEFYNNHRINEMVERYKRYIPENNSNPEYFFHSLFSLMARGWSIVSQTTETDLYDNVKSFLYEFSYNYSKTFTLPVMKVVLNEVADEIQRHDKYHITEDRIRYIKNVISEEWGGKKYCVPLDLSNECVLLPSDKPITTLEKISQLDEMEIVTEAKKEVSAKMNGAEKKIYKAYRTYKENEEKVDSQITKGVTGLKNVITGDVREEIIEGKKFSAIGLLKKLLATVALFSYGKIKFAILLVIRFALKKSTTDSERRKILMEIDTEIAMLEEKIGDAKSDNNREAKYAMMRTKKELENAKVRIQYGMSADKGSLSKTKKTLDQSRQDRGVV